MELVTKRNPRGGFVRSLAAGEVDAISTYYSQSERLHGDERNVVESLLTEMRREELWLQCDCGGQESRPFLFAKINDNLTLFLSSSGVHDKQCPFWRLRKVSDDTRSNGSRRTAEASRIQYRDILPRAEEGARVRTINPADDTERKKLTKKRLPRLGRFLRQLMEDSGLNRFTTSNGNVECVNLHSALQMLSETLDQTEFAQGRSLSEIVLLTPWIKAGQQQKLMDDLEKSAWPKGKEHAFYMIFSSVTVTRDEAVFLSKFGSVNFRPTRGMRINGEQLEGNRPPYMVILMFVRNADTREIECRDGYAHAYHARDMVIPVDSNKERDTINELLYFNKSLTKECKPPEMTVERPLFDIEVDDNENPGEKGFVIPDFLVELKPCGDNKFYKLVIETMGYDSDEYLERKQETHQAMRQIGRVVTDPPKWPEDYPRPLHKYLGSLVHFRKLE